MSAVETLNPDHFRARERKLPDNGNVPAHRIVTMGGDGFVDLASDDSENALAVTLDAGQAGSVRCGLLNSAPSIAVTSLDAAAAGDQAKLAASGKVQQGSGTIRLGVYLQDVEAGGVAEVVPLAVGVEVAA